MPLRGRSLLILCAINLLFVPASRLQVKAKDVAYLPHTAGRYQVKRFRKALCPIVERLANALMRKGRNNGALW